MATLTACWTNYRVSTGVVMTDPSTIAFYNMSCALRTRSALPCVYFLWHELNPTMTSFANAFLYNFLLVFLVTSSEPGAF